MIIGGACICICCCHLLPGRPAESDVDMMPTLSTRPDLSSPRERALSLRPMHASSIARLSPALQPDRLRIRTGHVAHQHPQHTPPPPPGTFLSSHMLQGRGRRGHLHALTRRAARKGREYKVLGPSPKSL